MNVIENLVSFNFDVLPDEWIDEVWSSDFLFDFDIPGVYENQNDEAEYMYNMVSLIESIKIWLNDELPGPSDASRKTWMVLTDLGFDHRALICFLSTFIKSEYNCQEDRILGLTASRLYVNLLSIPGAHVLNIFNPNLFAKIPHGLKLVKTCCFSGMRNIRQKKKRKKQDTDPMESPSEMVTPALSDSEKSEILCTTRLLLDDIFISFYELHLLEESESLTALIKALVDLTRIEKRINVICEPVTNSTTARIAKKSYDILAQLCVKEHGDVKKTVKTIIYAILPSLYINEEDFNLTNAEYNIIKKHSFSFITHLLNNNSCEEVEENVVLLVRLLCIKLPDREEIRSKCIPDLVCFLKTLPFKLFHEIVLWIVSFIIHETVKYKLVAADVILGLLNISDQISERYCPAGNEIEAENQLELKRMFKTMFAALINGIRDSSPLLRSKSAGHISKLLISRKPEIKSIMNEMFVINLNNDNNNMTTFFDFYSFFVNNPRTFPTNVLPPGNDLLKVFENLTNDEKVFVRKNACAILCNICLLNETLFSTNIRRILVSRCRDSYVSVKKNASQSLYELVRHYPTNEEAMLAWVEGALQLVVDDEISMSERAILLARGLIFDRIVPYNQTNGPEHKLPWRVLDLIARRQKRQFFLHACLAWHQQGLLGNNFVCVIKTHIGTENNTIVWFVIAGISQFMTVNPADFMYNYFLENLQPSNAVSEYLCKLTLECLYLNWKGLSTQTQERMFIEFKSDIEHFRVPFSLISRYMDFCLQYNSAEAREWSGVLVEKCEELLGKYLNEPNKPFKEIGMCQLITTWSEAAQFHPGVKPEIVSFMAKLVDSNHFGNGIRSVSVRVRAVAVVALGKVCLQDDKLAKSYSSLLADLLSKPSSTAVIKVNAMNALSDLCKRFTAVVEKSLGEMCVTLKDRDVVVRKNSLTVFMQLIQEDYLKLKGPLFFYLLIMRLDSSSEIRSLTDSFIINHLMKKIHHLMSHYFLNSIFFFNNYEDLERYRYNDLTQMEKIVFSLAGVNNLSVRRNLYKYMLKHMQDDERFTVCNKLCRDVLESVCKGVIPLNVHGTAVIKDALNAISCEEMRMENLRPNDPDNMEDMLSELAKRVFLTTIVKKNYMDNIIPILAELKKKLMDEKSPLQNDLMACFRELMKDYKDEINEILEDPLLAKEIALDLKNITIEEEIPDTPLVVSNPMKNVTLKELRIECERLSEEVLFDKFGIPKMSLTSPGFLPAGVVSPEGVVQFYSNENPSKRSGRAQSSLTSEPVAGPSSAPDPPPARRFSANELWDKYFPPEEEGSSTPSRKKKKSRNHHQGKPSSPGSVSTSEPVSTSSPLSSSAGTSTKRRSKKPQNSLSYSDSDRPESPSPVSTSSLPELVSILSPEINSSETPARRRRNKKSRQPSISNENGRPDSSSSPTSSCNTVESSAESFLCPSTYSSPVEKKKKGRPRKQLLATVLEDELPGTSSPSSIVSLNISLSSPLSSLHSSEPSAGRRRRKKRVSCSSSSTNSVGEENSL